VVDLGDLPSLGSAQHAEGLCKRCCFFPKGRCQNGKDCEFCHFDHEKRKRKKKKKKKAKQEEGSDSDDCAESMASTGGEVGTLGGGSRGGSISISAAGGSGSVPPAVGVDVFGSASILQEGEAVPTAGSVDFSRTASRDFSREGDADMMSLGGMDTLPVDMPAQGLAHLQGHLGLPLTAPPAMPPSLLVPVDQPPMPPMRLDGSHGVPTQMEVQSSWARNPFDVGAAALGYTGFMAQPVAHPEGYGMFASPYANATMCAAGMGVHSNAPSPVSPGQGHQGEPRLSTYSPFAPPGYGQPTSPQLPQVAPGHVACQSGVAACDPASPGGYRPPPR